MTGTWEATHPHAAVLRETNSLTSQAHVIAMVMCPYCGAQVKEPCRTMPNRRGPSTVHERREDRYRGYVAGLKIGRKRGLEAALAAIRSVTEQEES